MKGLVCGVGGLLLYAVLLSGTLGDPTEVCQPRNVSYNVADNKQCDKYHECTKAGKLLERLCDDGFVFSEEIHACDYPHNVNCSSRPALQPSRSTNPECERLNGFYAFPAATSCQKFHHCLEGRAYEKTCPEGVIFDPSKGTCIHPDLSKRPDCAAKSVLNFTCPNYGKKFVKLRFGDHDRLPHTTNCRKFFICLSDGKPRVGGCPLGKVFNPKLGVCDSPKRVPECKDYYGKKDLAKLEKLAQLGEEGALEDDEIENIEDEEEAEDPTSNEAFTQEQQETEEPPQPQPQPEAPKPKSKGKKFQPQLTKRQSQEGSSSEEANQANDNSSPSNKSSSADQTSSSKNSSSGKNGQKTDDEDDDDEDD